MAAEHRREAHDRQSGPPLVPSAAEVRSREFPRVAEEPSKGDSHLERKPALSSAALGHCYRYRFVQFRVWPLTVGITSPTISHMPVSIRINQGRVHCSGWQVLNQDRRGPEPNGVGFNSDFLGFICLFVWFLFS